MSAARTIYVTVDDDGEPVGVPTTTRRTNDQLCVCVGGESQSDVEQFLRWLSDDTTTGAPAQGEGGALARLLG